MILLLYKHPTTLQLYNIFDPELRTGYLRGWTSSEIALRIHLNTSRGPKINFNIPNYGNTFLIWGVGGIKISYVEKCRKKKVLRINSPIAKKIPSLCRNILGIFPASQLPYGEKFCFDIFCVN